MATRFESLPLTDQRLFGVRIHGAFGRGDRQRLMDLAGRCLEKGKTHLVFDFGDLDSLGGGGAIVLADLQRQLVEQGGEAVFVAPGEVIRRFLQSKFEGLPLQLFEDLEEAEGWFAGDDVEGQSSSTAKVKKAAPIESRTITDVNDLDALLDDYEAQEVEEDDKTRRTADLMTAVYVSVDETLLAASEQDNPALLGETLSILLDSHDLAAETIFCALQGDQYLSTDGQWRVPTEGAIAKGLKRIQRPLTILDLDDGELWDEESQMLEDMQPDLILPLIRENNLSGVIFLQHGGDEHEYNLPEVFALELLQRILKGERAPVAATPPPETTAPAVTSNEAGSETLLNVKLELARGLQDAQDTPHFWQVFISRLRLGVEVSSLAYLDTADPDAEPFLAGEARRGLDGADLKCERINTFFRTLERPVEIANMPVSFQAERDVLLKRGLQWIVGLRADDSDYLGAVALGVRWRCKAGEPTDEIKELMEITGEALLRLRENQRRADMSLGLLENLLVGESHEEQAHDQVTQETAAAVRLLACELGLPPDQERDLVLGALVRNYGQHSEDVDDLAADQLTGQDWETFRAHPDLGEQRMASFNAPAGVLDAVRHHHERFDGRGFPLGLKGRDIPLVARLIAVAQTYAMHRVASGEEVAQSMVQREAGQALDPDLVEIFQKASARTEMVPNPA